MAMACHFWGSGGVVFLLKYCQTSVKFLETQKCRKKSKHIEKALKQSVLGLFSALCLHKFLFCSQICVKKGLNFVKKWLILGGKVGVYPSG